MKKVFLFLVSTLLLAACQTETVSRDDKIKSRIAEVNKEIADGKARSARVMANSSTWTVRTYSGTPFVGIWSDNAGVATTGMAAIRVDLDNNAGDGLEVQMVYNGSDNGQLIFQDWTNVGSPTRTHYYAPNGWSGTWRDIYFDIPAQYLTATSDVYVTLRWRSFNSTSTSDWSYFTRHWYHGNKGY